MLINLSNHPSGQWHANQKAAAIETFGDIIDLPFPQILPRANTNEIETLANAYFKKCAGILDKYTGQANAVHVMGELTFSFTLVGLLQKQKIRCIASTSDRVVQTTKNGEKIVKFNFVMFREY